jgi:hypothetical protein
MAFVSGLRKPNTPMTKRKYTIVRVVSNSQLDLFSDAWYYFIYSDGEGSEVTHPTPFSSEDKARAAGSKYVEFLNG